MNELFPNAIVEYKTILAPFLMLTSCATLVWGLQNRFSRVYHAIRTLTVEGKRDDIDYSHSLESQISQLKKRAFFLRNGISGLYVSMALNLITVLLLTLTFVKGWDLHLLILLSFLLGLICICGSLVASTIETSRSFDTLEEDLDQSKT